MVTKILTVLILESRDQLFKFSSIYFSDSSKFSATNSCHYYNWQRNVWGFKCAQQGKERGKNRGPRVSGVHPWCQESPYLTILLAF